MSFELWDYSSGNALAGFATEKEALSVVRDEIAAAGPDAIHNWFLRKVNTRGRSKLIAEGPELAARSLAAVGRDKAIAAG